MTQKISINRIIVYCCITLFFSRLSAQDSLDIYLDYTRFFEDDKHTFVEIYYSFSRSSIEHSFDGENYVAEYSTKLDIYLGDSLLNSFNNLI